MCAELCSFTYSSLKWNNSAGCVRLIQELSEPFVKAPARGQLCPPAARFNKKRGQKRWSFCGNARKCNKTGKRAVHKSP